MTYDLYSVFDIEQHKKHYVNYLEIVISPAGKVLYAVPSHQEKLISIAMKEKNLTRNELWSLCPRNMWFDALTWLCSVTGYISVWNELYVGKPNRFQRHKLRELKDSGLYKGEVEE